MHRFIPANPLGSVMASMIAALGLAGAAVAEAAEDRLDWASLSLPAISGGQVEAGSLKGKVVLVVNTASYCGFTQQYEGLEALYAKYEKRGLVILGFPSNNFGQQEPGSAKQIADLCFNTYGVKFPMFNKTEVVGAQRNAFYTQLFQATKAAPQWNFHKYLISRDGRQVQSYASAVEPMGRELTAAIEAALQR